MDFLFKDRGSGKRAIKPSKEAEVLDALIPDHESDDSDFELDKHRGGGGDSDDNDTDDDKSNSEGSDEDSDSEAGGDSDNNESVDEDEVLRLKSNLTTEELISLAKRQTLAHASAGCNAMLRQKWGLLNCFSCVQLAAGRPWPACAARVSAPTAITPMR